MLPYAAYIIIGVVVYGATDDWCASLWQVVLLPLYGAMCFIGVKLFKKGRSKFKSKIRYGGLAAYILLILFFILLKATSVAWMRAEAMEDGRLTS